MNEITIKDVISDLNNEGESDAYYFDPQTGHAYHLHHFHDTGDVACMKNTGKTIRKISENEFTEAVNGKCFGNSINANSYYGLII